MVDVIVSQVLAQVDLQNPTPDVVTSQLLAQVDLRNTAPDVTFSQLLLQVDLLELLPPTAPSDLSATAVSHTTINLTWTDNSDDETGFKIARSLDDSDYSVIHTADANAESYVDTTCEPETLYYYKVLATSADGDSDYTTSASATTAAEPVPSGGGCLTLMLGLRL